MKKIITIVGPTASGKTSLAVKLSKKLNAEVISLDSRQLYNGMPIGTAQPTDKEMEGIPHHLIGFSDPKEPVSAGSYAKLVIDKVRFIQDNGKVPIICGGAGLYYRAIKRGIFKDSISDKGLREKLERSYDEDSIALMEKLKIIDPDYADIVHINNKKRLVRALEIFGATGRSPSDHFNEQSFNPSQCLDLFTVVLDWERENLIKRIEIRLEQMLSLGWVEEVNGLLEKQNKGPSYYPALNSIGYSQIQSYLNGEKNYDKMKEEILIKTRQFARRQRQWFKKENTELLLRMDTLEINEIVQILSGLFRVII
jgi:tRNA dimethylallyltransferase|tara:strand:+ start:1943 stop:2875 length:933 start_codon:yes stop_codon:yes gene_type:complete